MSEFMVALLLAGCQPEVVARDCEIRTAYYPDADGDGLGERTGVYFGCDAPAGWVTTLEPEPTNPTGDTAPTTGDTAPPASTADTGLPTGPPTATTADTGEPAETGDTAAPTETGDTGRPEATGDTGPAHTGTTGLPIDSAETADTGP